MQLNRAYFKITNTPGAAGDLVVGAAVTGPYRTLGAAQNGRSFEVAIVDGNAWEIRRGCTFTSATNTLTRGTLEDSSTGSAITLTSAALVMVTATAAGLNVPVLNVNGQGGTNQSVGATAWTKITSAISGTALVDTLGGWNGTTKRYTPTVAGRYLMFSQVKFINLPNQNFTLSGIYKNAAAAADVESARIYNAGGQTSDQESGIGVLITSMNGTSDFVELYGYAGPSAGTLTVQAHPATYLQSFYLGPL